MTYTKPLISVNRVASMIRCHHSTARTVLEAMGLESVELGKRRLYRTADVLARLHDFLATP